MSVGPPPAPPPADRIRGHAGHRAGLGHGQRQELAAIGDDGLASVPRTPRVYRWERGPWTDWPWWLALAGIVGGYAFAIFGSLLVAIPAGALGVRNLASGHVPAGVTLADTVVQDVGFVLASVLVAHVGGRLVRAWQFGLRRPRRGLRWVLGAVPMTYLVYLLLSAIWSSFAAPEKEHLLETLGANQGATLLALSALLTCVIAPVCEEFLFRGLIFQSLSNWRGVWPAAILTGLIFGGVHAGSAPAADLPALALLGFLLCLLYRATGSLYPCIAVHALNNAIAFGALEKWIWWQVVGLYAGALAFIALVAAILRAVGVITPEPSPAPILPPA